jgi:threonine dehydratase
MSASIPTLEEIREARSRIGGRIHETPVFRTSRLGDEIGAPLYVKCENLQKTGSFKPRGLLNRVLALDPTVRARGVVTISAGNAAQAVAWAAKEAGVPAVVVMPADASPTKAAASRGYGAEVVMHGNVHEAFAKTHEIEEERGLTFLHPFDDPDVVAGHGSAGLEVLEQLPEISVLVVPIGGGGLISGMAAAIKQAVPRIRIFGVEPTGACTMRMSLDQGHAVRVDQVHSVADGLAPPMAGKLNFAVVERFVDDVVLVSDEEIVSAMGRILEATKQLVEPSGAAAVAALLARRIPISPSDTVVSVLSGGNIGPSQIREYAATWASST